MSAATQTLGVSARDPELGQAKVRLAFILPASVSLMMTLGALLTALVRWRAPGLAERFALAAAAGLIAGESLAGVGAAFWQMLAS